MVGGGRTSTRSGTIEHVTGSGAIGKMSKINKNKYRN